MKNSLAYRLFIILTILIILYAALGEALAESYSASNMRLLGYEGEVEILGVDGAPRFVMENVRFSSGEAMRTGADGTASVSLDEGRIATLGPETHVLFEQQDNAMCLTMNEGSLMLDVREKLSDAESLDIRLSTMAVGIRGTVVFVSERNAAKQARREDADGFSAVMQNEADRTAVDANGRVSVLGVLEGTATLSYTDGTGVIQKLDVPAGSKAVLVDEDADGVADGAPTTEKVTGDDIDAYMAAAIASDEQLRLRIQSDGFEAFPADGEWLYQGKVTLVAQSASKMFNGEALTRPSDVLVYGLPDPFSISVAAGGSQTDAGESENPIERYTIRNSSGEDVTAHFTGIETVSGRLTVDPAPLTIWTGSAEKVYDGTPLTEPEAKLTFVPGYEKTMPWRNTSYVVSDSAGIEVLYGVSGTSKVHGTNPLTGETRQIELRTGERMSVFLSDEDDAQSIEFRIETIGEDGIPEALLRLYADNPGLLSQACQDAGWDEAIVKARIAALDELDREMVQQNGLSVEAGEAQRLMQDFTNVRITIDTEITSYNDRALGEEEARFTPVVIDESIVLTATGSQTDVGESLNTYTIDWGSARSENYIVEEDLGTLTVTPAPATVVTGSAEKPYDGAPLTSEEASITGLVNGETATVTAIGSQTNTGTSSNGYEIDWGSTNPANYALSEELGTLEVTGNDTPITFTAVSVTKVYDGQPLGGGTYTINTSAPAQRRPYALYRDTASTSPIRVEGLPSGLTFTATLTGSRKDAGESRYAITDLAILDAEGMDVTASFTNLRYVEGTLTILPAPASVSTGSAEKTYDGVPLVAEEAFIDGLIDGETAEIIATGSQTDVGESENSYAIEWGDTNPDNYEITEALGTLSVQPAPLTVTTESAEKLYDGLPLTNPAVTITGLADGETITVTVTGSQTEVGSSENSCAIDWGDTNAANYSLTEALGTLTVSRIDAPVVFTAGSAQKPYDGAALTYPEVSVSGLPAGFTFTATASGSQLDVGTAANVVDSYAIYNADGGDVTMAFTAIATVDGELTVTQNDVPIIITAPSNTRVYDGLYMEALGGATVEGLPEGLTIVMTAMGGRKDVGSSEISVSYYIMDEGLGREVSDNFTNIAVVPGTFTVTPAPVTIETGSAEKVYDGTALMKEDASITGLVPGDEGVVVIATGSLTDAGTAENTCSIAWGDVNRNNYTVTQALGTLTVTPCKVEFDLNGYTAVFQGYPCLPREIIGVYEGGASVEKVGEDFAAGSDGLETSVTAVFDLKGGDRIALYSEGAVDAGSHTVTPSLTYVAGNASNYDVTYTNNTFDIKPLEAEFSLGGGYDIYYDGLFHGGDLHIYCDNEMFFVWDQISDTLWRVTCFNGDWIDVTITGGGTAPGTYALDCTYAFAAGNHDNYRIDLWGETLSITTIDTPITLTAESLSKVYDGTPIDGTVSLTDGWLPYGYSFSATADGSRTDAGSSMSTVAEYHFYNENGIDVTDSFTNVTLEPGTLTVEPKEVIISTLSASKVYDGTALTAPAYIEGLIEADVSEVSVAATGSQTDVGSSENTYAVNWGSARSANYIVTEATGILTVSPIDIEIDILDSEFVFDNAYHTPDITVTSTAETTSYMLGDTAYRVFLPDGMFEVEFNTTARRKSAGSNDLTLGNVTWSYGNQDNYNIILKGGSLTVKPLPITITTGSAEKVYDGTPLTSSEVSVTGLSNGESIVVTPTAYVIDVGSAVNAFTIDWNGWEPENYEVTEVPGTLTVTPATLTITTGSATKGYNGDALTYDDASISGLRNGEQASVTATGSQTEVGVSANTYEITWISARPENYTIVEHLGALEVTYESSTEVVPIG